MTPDELAAIEARCDAATPGPWDNDGAGEISQHWSRPDPWNRIVDTQVACMSFCYGGSAGGVVEDADAEFIAHAREDIPALIKAYRAVENRVIDVEAALGRVQAAIDAVKEHEVVVDYVGVICSCGDRSDTRREFEEHRDNAARAALWGSV